jgi:hypothetical protein
MVRHEESTMYSHIGIRQLNAFAARAVLRLPDVRVLDGRVLDGRVLDVPVAARPARPPADSGAPPTPIEP